MHKFNQTIQKIISFAAPEPMRFEKMLYKKNSLFEAAFLRLKKLVLTIWSSNRTLTKKIILIFLIVLLVSLILYVFYKYICLPLFSVMFKKRDLAECGGRPSKQEYEKYKSENESEKKEIWAELNAVEEKNRELEEKNRELEKDVMELKSYKAENEEFKSKTEDNESYKNNYRTQENLERRKTAQVEFEKLERDSHNDLANDHDATNNLLKAGKIAPIWKDEGVKRIEDTTEGVLAFIKKSIGK